jgi:hypothetical protein
MSGCKCSRRLINLPLAERDRTAAQSASPASRMGNDRSWKRWKINMIDATDEKARAADRVIPEPRGALSR